MRRFLLSVLCILAVRSEAVEVIQFHEGRNDVAVVFIHGLGGHGLSSFTAPNGTLWLQLLRDSNYEFPSRRLPSEFSIYAVDYSTRTSGQSQLRIDDIATSIRDNMEFKRIFEDYDQVFFVAHSMGGLVLKRILLQYRRDRYDSYLYRVLGAAFLGVPAEGSTLADNVRRLGGVGGLILYLTGKSRMQVRELESVDSGNSFLAQLQADWAMFIQSRQDQRLPLWVPCAYETVRSSAFSSTQVVSRLFSSSSCSNGLWPIDTDHQGLVKPDSQEHPSHLWLLSSLEKALSRLEMRETVERGAQTSLKTLLRQIQNEWAYQDSVTNLRGSTTTVSVEPDVAELRLQRIRYVAHDYPALLERVAHDHSCLRVQVAPNRREVRLSLESPFQCTGGGVACVHRDC